MNTNKVEKKVRKPIFTFGETTKPSGNQEKQEEQKIGEEPTNATKI